jgi:hypothetical protein
MTELLSSTDLALARRIEAGHAHSAVSSMAGISVEAMADGWAMFHQVDSPVTQAIGIGMNGVVTAAELDRLEAFFFDHGSAAIIDLCTLADLSLVEMIQERGYAVREISNVMARRLDRTDKFELAPGITIEAVREKELRSWLRLVMQGFAGRDDVPEQQIEMLAVTKPALQAFFGLRDKARGGAAAMDVHAGLATLFGDATLLQARRQGLQLALIQHRLGAAAQQDCDLATACVLPGSVSHRNYERAGFQLLYGRVMVSRKAL